MYQKISATQKNLRFKIYKQETEILLQTQSVYVFNFVSPNRSGQQSTAKSISNLRRFLHGLRGYFWLRLRLVVM